MGTVQIRQARVKDAASIAPISREFLRQHSGYSVLDPLVLPSPEQEAASWTRMMRGRKYRVFIATMDDKTVGFMSLRYAERHGFKRVQNVGEIEALAVARHARGSGVGKQLFTYARGYFISQGIAFVQCNVRLSNPALAFWRKLGFREFDVRLYRRI